MRTPPFPPAASHGAPWLTPTPGSVTETFGVRATSWSNATGFSLNGKPFKILGNANHQDFPAVGVAVPDHLQWYRVQAQKNWGSNGWRTAHNVRVSRLLPLPWRGR